MRGPTAQERDTFPSFTDAPGVYGGNIVTCQVPQYGPAKITGGYLECLKICTADPVCETYEFMGATEDGTGEGNCTTRSDCDGVYSEDGETKRKVPGG